MCFELVLGERKCLWSLSSSRLSFPPRFRWLGVELSIEGRKCERTGVLTATLGEEFPETFHGVLS